MRPRFVLPSALALGLVVAELPAHAQPMQPTPEVVPAEEGNGPAAEAPERKAPRTPAAGYAYGDKATTSRKAAPRARYRKHGPVVNLPGFEPTADGGSRLFVSLSEGVPIEERKAQGSITYVLKGASPRVHNNTNALVTVHFNTPVTRARLVPRGADLHFVIELRAAATPTWTVHAAKDKSATLTVEFPKGDYLGKDAERAAAPAKGASRGARGPVRPAPAPAPPPPPVKDATPDASPGP